MLTKRNVLLALCSAALLTGGLAIIAPQALASVGFIVPEKDEEDVIKLADAPEPVRATFAKLATADAVTKVTKEEYDSKYSYEIEYKLDGVECSVILSPAGEIIETEKGIAAGTVPPAVLAELKEEYPAATLGKYTIVTKTYYEVEITENGKTREVTIDSSGKIEEKATSYDGEKDDDKDAKKPEAK